ncbi:hypothetical protein ACLMJK_009434 [Lecanora helva]
MANAEGVENWVNSKYPGMGPGHGARVLDPGHADQLDVPPVIDMRSGQLIPPHRFRRQVSECKISAISTTAAATATSLAPSCSVQDGDPTDYKHQSPACICSQGSSTSTFPQLFTNAGASRDDLCAYTTLSASTQLPTPNLSVSTIDCQVCTRGTINEDSCSTISGCVPTATAPTTSSLLSSQPTATASTSAVPSTSIPSTVVHLSRNSVHIGSHAGSQLYNEAWNAIRLIYPNPQNWKTASYSAAKASISSVGNVVRESPTEGLISFTVEDSQYSTTD